MLIAKSQVQRNLIVQLLVDSNVFQQFRALTQVLHRVDELSARLRRKRQQGEQAATALAKNAARAPEGNAMRAEICLLLPANAIASLPLR